MNQSSSNGNRHPVCITETRITCVDLTDAELEQARALQEGRWSHSHDETTGALIIEHIRVVATPALPGADLPWGVQEPV
ncbi:hypothetical protein [Ancylobacter polymorphus]|uniref:Uncharacterized protein n=1 Tax=Ancylobacter polymorphus TaxID=223390 RepID=A0A9E7D6W4_9HYPH|nr:hypothetical protein [Ancylobacter polymorphus]UOK73972.1 hypothetical protein K9D25_24840 [Ancylobacter polymorphus]